MWSVSSLLGAVADAIGSRLNPVAIQGEISGFTRASSGHCYFAIKDAQAQLRCAMFRRAANLMSIQPRNGDVVEVRGRLDVYSARGELQLIVESIQAAGQGALMAEFVALKNRLQAQGWFDGERKRALVSRPRHVALVTSRQAAALHDVVSTLQRRMPHVPVTLYPASVQGERAVPELLQALDMAAQEHRVHQRTDVLLLVRGGGSLEDLWAFNDERLAMALARMPMPVICGIGHESDFTIADFVADVRAPTPTAAAELAGVTQQEDLLQLQRQAQTLRAHAQRLVQQRAQSLDRIEQLLSRPGGQLAAQQARHQRAALQLSQAFDRARQQARQGLLDAQWRWQQQTRDGIRRLQQGLQQQGLGLTQAIAGEWGRHQSRLQRLGTRLEAMSPQHTLARGYAWLSDEQGQLVSSVQHAPAGTALRARLADGELALKVKDNDSTR